MTRFGLLGTFLAAIAIITWQELKGETRVPHPDVYIRACAVWAILGIISELGVPELASIFGVGLVLSMAYIYFTGKSIAGVNIGTMSGSRSLGTQGVNRSGTVAGEATPPTPR